MRRRQKTTTALQFSLKTGYSPSSLSLSFFDSSCAWIAACHSSGSASLGSLSVDPEGRDAQ
ncbi:MAG: hypothetical protein MRK00_16480 [Nitrosomonas sp.]|nr:hypothetical protein [Nitrosomonas sp.]